MPTENEISGAISHNRAPRPSPTQVGNRKLKPQTLMLGYGFDPELSEGSLKPPIFLTSTFVFENAAAGKRFFEGVTGKRPGGAEGLIYSRFNGPNQVEPPRLTHKEVDSSRTLGTRPAPSLLGRSR